MNIIMTISKMVVSVCNKRGLELKNSEPLLKFFKITGSILIGASVRRLRE